jgi:hypothetical protein
MKTSIVFLLPTFIAGSYLPLCAQVGADGLGETPDRGHPYVQNKGQILNTQGQQVGSVKFAVVNSPVQCYVHDSAQLSFVSVHHGPTPGDDDTLRRIDVRFMANGEVLTPIPIDPDGLDTLPGVTHSYRHVPTTGVEDIHSFNSVIFREVYSDIDVQLSSNSSGFKAYLIIKPGGDPGDIILKAEGQDSIQTDGFKLDIMKDYISLSLSNSVVYELDDDNNVNILNWQADWVEVDPGVVMLTTETWDTDKTLVIQISNPVAPAAAANDDGLLWSTYVSGSTFDQCHQVFDDEQGNTFYIGETHSTNFPIYQGVMTYQGNADGFVVKFNHFGELVFSTYYGGVNDDVLKCGTVSGSVLFVGGHTRSPNLINSWSSSYTGSSDNGWFGRFNLSTGGLIETHYFGNSGQTFIEDMITRPDGRVVMVGHTNASGIPLTDKGSAYYDNTHNGSWDGFFAVVNSNGGLYHASYVGGAGQDRLTTVAAHENGVHIAGYTTTATSENICGVPSSNNNLPLCTPGSAYTQTYGGSGDIWLMELSTGLNLSWSTWVGGTDSEDKPAITVNPDDANEVFLACQTSDPSTFPIPASPPGYVWSPSSSGNQQTALLRYTGRVFDWQSFFGCDDGQSHSTDVDIVHSGSHLFVSGITSCDVAQTSNLCNPPTGSAFAVCNANSARWQQEDYVPTGPASRGGQETYLAAFDNNLDLDWTTWYGGGAVEQFPSITYDGYTDELHIAGGTSSPDATPIPLKPLPYAGAYYQNTNKGAQMAGYLARFPAISNWALSNKQKGEEDVQNHWQVLPNPASEKVQIHNPYPNAVCTFVGAEGKVYRKLELNTGNNHLDLSGLSAGFYFVKLEYQDRHEVHKLVVQ